MYYVYHGYVNSDNYDASEGPIFKLSQCETEEQVLELKKEFDEGIYDGCAHITFRVIEGKELELIPKEKVIVWKLE
jgi:hypothetical protein